MNQTGAEMSNCFRQNSLITRSCYRKESAAVMHKWKFQLILNIEIANDTLQVLICFVSK